VATDDELTERVERLEHALLLLAKHVGAVGWNYELQKALDTVRYPESERVDKAKDV
jgi:hypothetical protein